MDPQSFVVQRGETVKLPITVTESGSPKDLTGATVEFHMARLPGSSAVVSTSIPNCTAAVRAPASGGIIDVEIADDVTETLQATYYWECEAEDSAGDKATVARGYATFRQNIV